VFSDFQYGKKINITKGFLINFLFFPKTSVFQNAILGGDLKERKIAKNPSF